MSFSLSLRDGIFLVNMDGEILSIGTKMKYHINYIVIASIGFTSAILFCTQIYFMGHLLDLNPTLIPNSFTMFHMGSLLVTIYVIVFSIIHVFKRKSTFKPRFTVIISVFLILLLAINIIPYNRYYSLRAPSGFIDEQGNLFFSNITLNEFIALSNDNSNTEYLIYVGRSDCNDCMVFESSMGSILWSNDYKLLTYFTNNDREGDDSEKLYSLLDTLQIQSVPHVFVLKNGSVIKSWPNPTENINEIEILIVKSKWQA